MKYMILLLASSFMLSSCSEIKQEETYINANNFERIYGNFYKNGNKVYYKDILEIKELEGSDPVSFEILDYDYSKDKDDVYYDGKKINGADSESFETIDYLPFGARDKNFVYYHGRKQGTNNNL